MSKRNNNQHKNYLRQLSDKRKAAVGAPNFGINEQTVLQMKLKVDELVNSNNKLVKAIDEFNKHNVVERSVEAHYMANTIIKILLDKGICTEKEVQDIAESLQAKDLGLADKSNSTAELGDHMLIKFKLFDNGKVVDDQTTSPLAYVLGSKGLPGEDAMVGMKVGEQRMIDVTFGEGFKFKEYVNKPLQMQLACVGVKARVVPQPSASL